MNKAAATLHAGLLARKGEARPSAQGEIAIVRGGTSALRSDTTSLEGRLPPGPRVIELPRQLGSAAPVARMRRADSRRHLHARLENGLHYRLKVAAARLDRTQQDLVASALDAYLAFLDEDVFVAGRETRTAGA